MHAQSSSKHIHTYIHLRTRNRMEQTFSTISCSRYLFHARLTPSLLRCSTWGYRSRLRRAVYTTWWMRWICVCLMSGENVVVFVCRCVRYVYVCAGEARGIFKLGRRNIFINARTQMTTVPVPYLGTYTCAITEGYSRITMFLYIMDGLYPLHVHNNHHATWQNHLNYYISYYFHFFLFST